MVPLKYKKQLYYALIHPHLTYGIELWGNKSQTTLKPLITLQKRALRFITNTKFRSPSLPIFNRLKIPNIHQLYSLKINQMMFVAFHNELPPNVQKYYSRNQGSYNTRNSNLNLVVCRRSTMLQGCRPSVCGPFSWNSLPDHIKSARKTAFKHKIKTFVLQ